MVSPLHISTLLGFFQLILIFEIRLLKGNIMSISSDENNNIGLVYKNVFSVFYGFQFMVFSINSM